MSRMNSSALDMASGSVIDIFWVPFGDGCVDLHRIPSGTHFLSSLRANPPHQGRTVCPLA